jgi:hypothetical protein
MHLQMQAYILQATQTYCTARILHVLQWLQPAKSATSLTCGGSCVERFLLLPRDMPSSMFACALRIRVLIA